MTAVTETRAVRSLNDYLAMVRAARTFKRLAHEYKRMALAAELDGKLSEYRRFRKEAERLWKSAYWHIRWARRTKEAAL